MSDVPILIIASHGRLAAAALESACQIFGPIESASAVALEPNGRLEDLESSLKGILRAHPGRPAILLVDLFGGSCANVGARILKAVDPAIGPVRVIAGFNLAMLVEFAFSRDKMELDALADRMLEAGRKACLDVNAKLKGVAGR